jgi:hypothetical protein
MQCGSRYGFPAPVKAVMLTVRKKNLRLTVSRDQPAFRLSSGANANFVDPAANADRSRGGSPKKFLDLASSISRETFVTFLQSFLCFLRMDTPAIGVDQFRG